MTNEHDEEQRERPTIRITDRRIGHREEGGAPPSGGAASREASEPRGPEPSGGDEALAAARRQADEYLDQARRLQAEFDNYRKRVLKEQTRAVELAAEPMARRLLEVLDDFELALMAAQEKPEFERFLKGVELVYAKLVDGLKSEGLERIEAEGAPFDPSEHEALMQTGQGEGEPIVADVLRQGYRLNGHVIRPAGVRVERRSGVGDG
jgi:molecular chaperone GrpE